MQIEGFRLSPQQKHLWSLQAEHNQLFLARCCISIEGVLNTELLKTAIRSVIGRQEILRTTFQSFPGLTLPVQVISENHMPLVEEHDLSEFSTREQNERVEGLFQEAKNLGFDLEREPLLRISVLKLSQERHVLIVVLPALCTDAVGLDNLMREIGRSYGAFLQNGSVSDEVRQYADLAEWQNELLETDDGEIGRAFWQKQHTRDLLTLKLPFENGLSIRSSFAAASLAWALDPNSVQKIDEIAQRCGTQGSVFLLACWQVLLWRLTGEGDIVVGLGDDGRKYEELTAALGLFTKYLPLRIDLEGNISFIEVLRQVDQSVTQAREWQEFFSWERMEGKNDANRESPFLPFCYDFEEWSGESVFGPVSFSIKKRSICVDRFKVKLSCVQREASFDCVVHYDSSLYQTADIQRLAGQFRALLERAIDHPEATIGELEIISDAERRQVLVTFNSTRSDYPKDKCIHELIEEQARRTPGSMAVVFEDHKLTYAQLDSRANQLAHHLRSLGIAPDALVGICVERSVEMVVGIVGILKAGAAYLPLDPSYPKDRLGFMLEDSKATVLLTKQALVEKLPKHDAQLVRLDTDWATIARESASNPETGVATGNLAYVIYTSGSMGVPKGVLVTHRNLVHSTYARTLYYNEAIASFALLSSFAFDSSVAGIFWTLCQGGALVLPQQGLEQDLPRLQALIARNHISHMLSLPSLYGLLLEQAQPQQLSSLRTVIVAGEACPGKLAESHRGILPQTALFNEYGPTEGTVWSSVHRLDMAENGPHVSIGRSIANTQIYLLDRFLRPVPIGVPGELYIGGDGVARGYLNQPGLTAERFIPDPFSSDPGARLYKTGDMSSYLRNGNLEFLGRMDNQVKVRGYRIELSEIETAISQCPGVQDAVVVAREDEPGIKRLIAYVVLRPEFSSPVGELRRFLAEKLPDYMVPSSFVRLSKLPILPNGKVDRRALPKPDQERPELEGTFTPARTPVEERLQAIWTEVLGVKQVGIFDNFFELGGDSILSIRIIAKANQAGLQITPMQIFQHQTIAELAKVAGATRTVQAEQGLVTGSLPLTPIERWFFEQNPVDPHHANIATLLEVQRDLDISVLKRAVSQLLEHHDALRLRFVHGSVAWEQRLVLPEDKGAVFIRVDLSGVPEIDQGRALERTAAELQAGLNLLDGPMVRVALFDMGPAKPNRLLLVIHHLAVDVVSLRILLEDLQTSYQKLSRGETLQLPPKTTSFKYWAQKITAHAKSDALRGELDYWLARDRRDDLHLPVDFPEGRQANSVASTRTVSVSLSPDETRSLLQEVPKSYHTQINDVLLTALARAFAQWTGKQSLLVDFEAHGREDIFQDVDLSRTVGWFTTLCPVVLQLGNASDLGDALKAIKEQLRQIPNRGIGYGLLRYLSDDERILSELRALPRPEVNFNYLGQLDQLLQDSHFFSLARESIGPDRSLLAKRPHLLEIVGLVMDGCLKIDWSYSDKVHRQTTIETLAQSFIDALRTIISHCRSSGAESYTPSDFPEAELNQKELEDLLAQLNESD